MSCPPFRLVPLTGVGSGGKTRLAMAVAETVAGDGCWVSLAGTADSVLVPQTAANALGVIESPDRTLLDGLVLRLSRGQPLLVLDNCEPHSTHARTSSRCFWMPVLGCAS